MTKRTLLMSIVLSLFFFQSDEANAKKREELRVQGGAKIDELGFAIDASYDPRLDRLVPGYKILNVVVINSSLTIVSLNPDRDAWSVRAGKKKKSYRALIDLRRDDPEAWSSLPQGARNMLAYPLVIPIGAKVVLDLFVDDRVPLDQLTEVVAKLDSLETPLRVLVRSE